MTVENDGKINGGHCQVAGSFSVVFNDLLPAGRRIGYK